MENKIEYYGKEDRQYPQRLRVLPGSPGRLYVKGELPPEDRPAVAVVGARICSEYGRSQAFEFARILAEHGVAVISGLARGIDAAAHRGALAGGGRTYAVLGSGVDNCYPKMNFPLYCEILESGGGILSEFPPLSRPEAWHFPVRNRIISGLADAVLVIEARKRSGSLITADCALEQGRTVFALPGRVGDALSEGCNYLIYQGAVPAYSPEAVLQELESIGYGSPGRAASAWDGEACAEEKGKGKEKEKAPQRGVRPAEEKDAGEPAQEIQEIQEIQEGQEIQEMQEIQEIQEMQEMREVQEVQEVQEAQKVQEGRRSTAYEGQTGKSCRVNRSKRGREERQREKNFSGDTRLVYDSLELMPKGLGILAAETGLSIQVLSGILLTLQRDGWADEAPRNYWRRYQRRCAGTAGY